MKLVFAKKAYDKLNAESQSNLERIPCDCIKDGEPDIECENCDGLGNLYELKLSAEEEAEIQANLASQGVPLGKAGAH